MLCHSEPPAAPAEAIINCVQLLLCSILTQLMGLDTMMLLIESVQ